MASPTGPAHYLRTGMVWEAAAIHDQTGSCAPSGEFIATGTIPIWNVINISHGNNVQLRAVWGVSIR